MTSVRTLIKICGLTRPDDADQAVSAGADAVGLVFYPPSPRAVSVGQAQELIAAIPPFVTVVGLFVDPDPGEVAQVLASLDLDMLQFHGSESPAFCASFHRPWLKAVAMREGTRLDRFSEDYAYARGLLLDAWQEKVPGGTGTSFDWRANWGASRLPLVLAGGLNPDNVGAAMSQMRPQAVDVSSGVELEPGIKDPSAMTAFVDAVRRADKALASH